jgi:multiple sugar transport system permease protein
VTNNIKQKKKKRGLFPLNNRQWEAIAAYGFLLPNFIGFLVFTSIPVLISLVLAFTNWDVFRSPQWVGLYNFRSLLGFTREQGQLVPNDPFFWKYIFNTVFMMLGLPIGMAVSLIMALIFNQKIKGIMLFRTLFFLPTVCSGVATLILWKYLYNNDVGLFNTMIYQFGKLLHMNLNGPDWIGTSQWAKPSLILMGLWGALGGFSTILYLAALQNVPKDMYEAAEIDGANNWKKFWAITWPMISPTTFFVLIMGVIGGFQTGFMTASIMTGGGPAGSTITIEYYIYNTAFTLFHMGYASAIAWVLFAVIFLLTMVTWKFGGRVVTYD